MSGCAHSITAAGLRLSSLPKLPVFSGAFLHARRCYAVQAGGAPRFQVFNRRTKWLQKERIAAIPEESRQADYIKDEVAIRVTERLLVSKIDPLGPS